MSLTQPNSAAVWTEEQGSGVALGITLAGYRKDAGYWEPFATTAALPV